MEKHIYSIRETIDCIASAPFDTKIIGVEGDVEILEHNFDFIKNKKDHQFMLCDPRDEDLYDVMHIVYSKITWEYIACSEKDDVYHFRLVSSKIPPTRIKYSDRDGNVKEILFEGRILEDLIKDESKRFYNFGCTYLVEFDDNLEERIRTNFETNTTLSHFENYQLLKIIDQKEFTVELPTKTKACR